MRIRVFLHTYRCRLSHIEPNRHHVCISMYVFTSYTYKCVHTHIHMYLYICKHIFRDLARVDFGRGVYEVIVVSHTDVYDASRPQQVVEILCVVCVVVVNVHREEGGQHTCVSTGKIPFVSVCP